MNKPKMILFDYGNTLLCEPIIDTLHGEEALFTYIKSNKNNLTPKQVNEFADELFSKTQEVRNIGYEIHELQFQRFLYEYLEIELSISLIEAERVFWDNVSIGECMPNAEKMLEYINANGIRSGVISNISFSGEALADRINRLLPQNKFEFIIASSEYMFRKPSPMLFELALKKAGLDAENVWFCGDNIKADVEGAAAVGIFPIWYEDELMENPWRGQDKRIIPNCDHLHIHDWMELIAVLEEII